MARTLAATAASLVTLLWLAGCATDRLDTAPPKGVDLTGEWQLNPSLSDDPQRPLQEDSTAPNEMHHHSGRGRVGLPPFGLPGGAGGPTGGGGAEPDGNENLTSNTTDSTSTNAYGYGYVRTLWQNQGNGSSGATGGTTGGRNRGSRLGHWLDAPERMRIQQSGGHLTIQSKSLNGELQTDELVSGHSSDIPFGQSTADRDVGWRGNIFVVDTKVKSGPTREDDYALDEDGRLIVSTLLTGGNLPKVDIKRVYDRVTGAQGVHQ